MHNDGAGIQSLQAVQSDHGDGGTKGTRQGYQRCKVPFQEPGLLHQDNPRRGTGHGQPNGSGWELLEERPGE
jgi:hypothetical protein